MSVASSEFSPVSSYDGSVAVGQVVDVSGEEALRREAIALLESLDDPQNTTVNLLLKRPENDPVLREYRLTKRMLELAVDPGAGNHNIKVNMREQIGIMRSCIQRASVEAPARVETSPGVTGKIRSISGWAGNRLKRSLSLFS